MTRWITNNPRGTDLLVAILICLFFWLSDYYVAHLGGYTMLEAIHTVENVSATARPSGIWGRATPVPRRQAHEE